MASDTLLRQTRPCLSPLRVRHLPSPLFLLTRTDINLLYCPPIGSSPGASTTMMSSSEKDMVTSKPDEPTLELKQSSAAQQKSSVSIGVQEKSSVAIGVQQKSSVSIGVQEKSSVSIGVQEKSSVAIGVQQKSSVSIGVQQKSSVSIGVQEKSSSSTAAQQQLTVSTVGTKR